MSNPLASPQPPVPGSEKTQNPEPRTPNSDLRHRNGRWQIACAECAANQTGPAWRSVVIRAWATYIFYQTPGGGHKTLEGNWRDPEYLCAICGADVGYMLSEKIKAQLLDQYVT